MEIYSRSETMKYFLRFLVLQIIFIIFFVFCSNPKSKEKIPVNDLYHWDAWEERINKFLTDEHVENNRKPAYRVSTGVEKLHLNTPHTCDLCEVEIAVAQVYGLTRYYYDNDITPPGIIRYCSKCGPLLAERILAYSH